MKRCGAKTRSGMPCQRYGVGRGGRCRLHGGASTGPRSVRGRKRIAAAQHKRWAKWRKINPEFMLQGRSARTARRIRRTFHLSKMPSDGASGAPISVPVEVHVLTEAHLSASQDKAQADRAMAQWLIEVVRLAAEGGIIPDPPRQWPAAATSPPAKVERHVPSLPPERVRAVERHERQVEEPAASATSSG
jgi:hypothetical protein